MPLKSSRMALVIAILSLLLGCAEPASTKEQASAAKSSAETQANQAADNESSLPPGFTDAPPPGPESDTLVLSGGTLMLDNPTPDSVVVVQNGRLLAWGVRGEVDLPHDSIGMDMRGKWVVPGTVTEIQVQGLPSLKYMRVGGSAAFVVFEGSEAGANFDAIYGVLADGSFEETQTPPSG